MALNFKIVWNGLKIKAKAALTSDTKGELEVLDSDGKLYYHNGTSRSVISTNTSTDTITNKTIDADLNTITNIENADIKAGANIDLAKLADGALKSTITVNSSNITDLSIVNADINASAAIVDTKLATISTALKVSNSATTATELNTASAIVARDASGNFSAGTITAALNGNATTATTSTSTSTNANLTGPVTSIGNATTIQSNVITSAMIVDDTIVNADINSAAAIAKNKLAAGTASKVEVTDASGFLVESTVTTTELGLLSGVAAPLVTTTGTQTLTNKTITTPAITSPTGLVKADVGLANVDNTSDATKNSATVTLTNKTITGADFRTPSRLDFKQDTFANLVTYAITASNGQAVYATDTKAAYIVKDAELAAMGGAGGGGINYIPDPQSELVTTVWIPYADAAGTSPVDGTGGSPVVTVSNSTSSPLRGLRSLVMVKDAANRQGNGISVPFTIDPADKHKVLQISFDYAIASGSFVDGDVTFWIYDITNSVMIQPAPTKLMNVIGTEKMGMEFQASDSTSYRLIAHVSSVSALAYNLKFDNFFTGVSAKSYGSPIVDAKTYTPTGTWTTNTVYTGLYSKIGDTLYGTVKVILSGAPVGNLTVNIPSGLTIDTAKLPNPGRQSIGDAIGDKGATSYTGDVFQNDTTSVAVISNAATSRWGATVPVTWASGDVITINFKVPIAGWSSSTIMSSDADTRVVAARVYGATTSIGTTNTTVIYPSTTFDTHGAYNNSTGEYKTPISGFYRITTYQRGPSAVWSINSGPVATAYLNGSAYSTYSDSSAQGGGSAYRHDIAGSLTLKVKAGDIILIKFLGTPATVIDQSASHNSWTTFERISGPSQIAASESVSARYSAASGQSIASGVTTIVDFNTKDYDSHNAVTTGSSWKFTAPISGKYLIIARAHFNAASFTSGNSVGISIYKNGAVSHVSITRISITGSFGYPASGSDILNMLAGDTIDIRVDQSEGSNRALQSFAPLNNIAITRVGN